MVCAGINGNYGGGSDPYPPPPIVNDTMLGKGHEGKEGLLDFKPGLSEMEGKPGELG